MQDRNGNKKADKWTIIATVGEGFANALSNFYWGVSIAGLAYSTQDEATQSNIPLFVGTGFALLSMGSMYAHQKLNTYHQTSSNEKKPLTAPIEQSAVPVNIPRLSTRQKAALWCDFFTHCGEISGAVTAAVDLIIRNHSLVRRDRILIQCAATLFGATTSVANVRSCKNAILAQNPVGTVAEDQRLEMT